MIGEFPESCSGMTGVLMGNCGNLVGVVQD
jgi:hypothetical protein